TYSDDSSIMLRITWELFAGGGNRGLEREALWRAAQARSDRNERLIFAREDLRDSWHALEAGQARVINFEEALVRNTETRDAYRQQFTVGQRTLLDVLDAENELFVTDGQLATERTNVVRAGYRILASLGQLLATVGVEPPEQATREVEDFGTSVDHIIGEDREPTLD
ncbi:MAG: TolC family protein, partial [Alphaproteobacteria bacterium]